MENHLINYLLKFRDIPEKEQQQIINSFEVTHYKSGVCLSDAGQIMNQLIFINKGILKITIPENLENEEEEITYYFMNEHQFMGFLYSMYGDIPAKHGLQAACDTEVLLINKKELYDLYEQLPYLKGLINEISNLSMANMINVISSYTRGTSLTRYQLFLKQQPEIAMNVAQIDIASYLGITPQSLSRIRKKLVSG